MLNIYPCLVIYTQYRNLPHQVPLSKVINFLTGTRLFTSDIIKVTSVISVELVWDDTRSNVSLPLLFIIIMQIFSFTCYRVNNQSHFHLTFVKNISVKIYSDSTHCMSFFKSECVFKGYLSYSSRHKSHPPKNGWQSSEKKLISLWMKSLNFIYIEKEVST